MSIDSTINNFFKPFADIASGIVFYSVPIGAGQEAKVVLLWLAAAAVFFTVYLGFINIRFFGRSIKLLFSDGMSATNDGEISQFRALMASLSGTVGLGNIAGVAVAISTGGPGAAFWMTIMGLLGMSSKFAEVMLGVKYRRHPDKDNVSRVSGGPMYYLHEGFARLKMPKVGAFIAGLFAACCIAGAVGGGNMFQANQTYKQLLLATTDPATGISALEGSGWIIGLILSFLVGIVIIGGIRSIAAVASKIVPLMAAIYLGSGLLVILMSFTQIPAAFATIITEAFSLKAGLGGLLGGILIGVQRAAFSNEAGLGSAAIVQSTANTEGPVGTGIVAMLGPFIDTVIICNITALVIVITGVYSHTEGLQGVELTSAAFETVIPNFRYVLTLIVFLFAYSTMISWYYCGAICVRYLFGEKDAIENVFKALFCFCVIIGCSADLGNLIDFTDAALMSAAFPNILGLFMFAPEIKKDLKEYVQGIKSQ